MAVPKKQGNLVVLPTAKAEEPKKKRKGKRADGRSQAMLDLGRDAAGKRIRKVFYGKTYTEAKGKADAFKRQLDSGISPDLMDITLADWVELCRPRYNAGCAEPTIAWHNRNLNALVAAFPGRTVGSLRPMELQEFLDKKEGETHSAISKRRGAMNYVFGQAVINGVILRNPVTDLETPGTAEDGSHRALEPWETEALLEGWQRHDFGLAAVIERFAGLRPQEALILNLKEDIDIENTAIHIDKAYSFGTTHSKVVPPKTKSGYRDAPITEPLLSILRFLRQTEPDRSAVYAPRDGRPLTRGAVYRGWHAFTKAVGLTIQQYDLRHSFATEVDDTGLVKDSTLQYWMGHKPGKKETITKRVYIHKKKARIEADKKALQEHMAEQYKSFILRISLEAGSHMVVKPGNEQ